MNIEGGNLEGFEPVAYKRRKDKGRPRPGDDDYGRKDTHRGGRDAKVENDNDYIDQLIEDANQAARQQEQPEFQEPIPIQPEEPVEIPIIANNTPEAGQKVGSSTEAGIEETRQVAKELGLDIEDILDEEKAKAVESKETPESKTKADVKLFLQGREISHSLEEILGKIDADPKAIREAREEAIKAGLIVILPDGSVEPQNQAGGIFEAFYRRAVSETAQKQQSSFEKVGSQKEARDAVEAEKEKVKAEKERAKNPEKVKEPRAQKIIEELAKLSKDASPKEVSALLREARAFDLIKYDKEKHYNVALNSDGQAILDANRARKQGRPVAGKSHPPFKPRDEAYTNESGMNQALMDTKENKATVSDTDDSDYVSVKGISRPVAKSMSDDAYEYGDYRPNKDVERVLKQRRMSSEERVRNAFAEDIRLKLNRDDLPSNFVAMIGERSDLYDDLLALKTEASQAQGEQKEELNARVAEKEAQIQGLEKYIIEAVEARKKAEAGEAPVPPEAAKETEERKELTPVEMEHMAAESMKSTELGKEMYGRIETLQSINRPVKRGFIDRIVLSCTNQEEWEKYNQTWREYNEGQRELKQLKTAESDWSRREQQLIAEVVSHKDKMDEYLSKVAEGTITKREWKDYQKLVNKFALMRMNIDANFLAGVKERFSLEKELPQARDWPGLKLDQEFQKTEEQEKGKLVTKLKGGELFQKEFAGLSPEYQKLFLNEEAGRSLKKLAEAKAEKELLLGLIREQKATENPYQLFQLVNRLHITDFEIKRAEAMMQGAIRDYSFKESAGELGQKIKTAAKRTLGAVLKTDKEFDINFDTEVNEIILNGHSNFSKAISGTLQFGIASKFAVNRTHWGLVATRKMFNEGFAKIAPSSSAREKVIELTEKIADLDDRRNNLDEILTNIVSTRAEAHERMEALVKEASLEKRVVIFAVIEQTVRPEAVRFWKNKFDKQGLTPEFADLFVRRCQEEKLVCERKRKAIETELQEATHDQNYLTQNRSRIEERMLTELAEKLAEAQDAEIETLEDKLKYALSVLEDREKIIEEVAKKKIAELRNRTEKSMLRKVRTSLSET